VCSVNDHLALLLAVRDGVLLLREAGGAHYHTRASMLLRRASINTTIPIRFSRQPRDLLDKIPHAGRPVDLEGERPPVVGMREGKSHGGQRRAATGPTGVMT
jgi:hypothetical protein